MVRLERFVARRACVPEEDRVSALTPEMLGVVRARLAQVHAVQERLAPLLQDVLVDTSNRFQGLERPIMVVHHPLSGRADADPFHLDAGRLCVTLSRHPVACVVVARAGIEDVLRRYVPRGEACSAGLAILSSKGGAPRRGCAERCDAPAA